MTRLRGIGVLAVLVLSGCGGGGGDAPPTLSPEGILFVAKENKLVQNLNTAMALPSFTPNLPNSGTANYAGQVGVNLTGTTGNASIVGDMALAAQFMTNSVTGSMSNLLAEDFSSAGYQQLGGSLSINGTYDVSANITADLTGSVTFDNAGATETAIVDMDMTGAFSEVVDPTGNPAQAAQIVGGSITGNVTGDILLTVTGGSFIGENTAEPNPVLSQ